MKIKVFALAFMVALAATGCVRIDETIYCNESNKITSDTKSYVKTDVYDDVVKEGGTFTLLGEDFQPENTEMVDGIEYYVQNKTETLTEKEFLKEKETAVISNESFYIDLTSSIFNSSKSSGSNSSSDSLDEMNAALSSAMREYIDGYTLTVKFDHDVTKTNGKAKGKSAVFEFDPAKTDYTTWYAYTNSSTHTLAGDKKIVDVRIAAIKATDSIYSKDSVDKVKPVIKFVKSKSNNKKIYILVKDNKKLKKVIINGKKYTDLKKRKITSGNYKGYYSFSSTKKGKNKVVAYDAAGNVRKGSFTIK